MKALSAALSQQHEDWSSFSYYATDAAVDVDEDSNATILRRELKHSAFERKFTLGESLDGDNIKANFKDGLLSIEIPKIEPVKPERKSIRIS